MRHWWSRRVTEPSHEAKTALWQAERALVDAERLDAAAAVVERKLRETRARNHFREAFERSARRA